jgi:N-acetylglucosamine kinase-like BadF-type ATPase
VNLVVDLGQSGARVKLGSEISTYEIAKNSAESVIETLERIFKQMPRATFENAYLSLTGLQGDVKEVRPYGELCNRYFGTTSVCVMDDGVASYLGALGDRDGVVLTLGGGVVAIASNAGKFGHADGKGPIFGDFGGGFWVGKSAMNLAISTLDGRGNAHDLVELLSNELSEYQTMANTTGVEASQLCIRSAKQVTKGAEQGSVNAVHILEEGARYLAITIQAAWKKVNQGAKVPALSIQGGLSKSAFYVGLIKNEVSKTISFDYVTGDGDHLAGAPKAAAKYVSDVSPLLKWWRA